VGGSLDYLIQRVPRTPDINRQLATERILFPAAMKNTDRRDGFQESFLEICEELPSSKHSACSYIDVLRCALIEDYKKVEATLPHSVDWRASGDIYDIFKKIFVSLQDLEFALAFIPDIHRELRANSKRSRAESTNTVPQKRRE